MTSIELATTAAKLLPAEVPEIVEFELDHSGRQSPETSEANEGNNEQVKEEKTVVEYYWISRVILPFILVALRTGAILAIRKEHEWHKIVAGQSAWLTVLQLVVGVSLVSYIGQVLVNIWFAGLEVWKRWPHYRGVLAAAVQCAQRRTIDQWMTLLGDFLYVVVNMINIHLFLRDNCFRVGSKGSPSLMDHFVTKGQLLVLFPLVLLAVRLLVALKEACSACSGRNRTNGTCVEAVREFGKVLVVPLQFAVAMVMVWLWIDGLCFLESFKITCPNVIFTVSVTSHVRYTLNSNVLFPDPKLGLKVRNKVVDIQYRSYLSNPGSSDVSERCKDRTSNSIESDNVEESFCNSGAYYVASNTQHLGTNNGILLEWPCNETNKIRQTRDNVACLYRMKIILNDQYKFVFNYDYVYRIPESVSEVDSSDEWNKRSKYKPFSSFVNTGGSEENFQIFRNLFNKVDRRLASYTPVLPNSNTLDLLMAEPHVLHIECNRTCFCYRCIGTDEEILSQPYCMRICPDVNVHSYRNYSKSDFCRPQNKDGCISVWKPISSISLEHNIRMEEIATFQSPPVVNVLLDSGNVSATLDPMLMLQAPGVPPRIGNCPQVLLLIVIVGVGLFLVVVLLVFWCLKFNRIIRRGCGTASRYTTDGYNMGSSSTPTIRAGLWALQRSLEGTGDQSPCIPRPNSDVSTRALDRGLDVNISTPPSPANPRRTIVGSG